MTTLKFTEDLILWRLASGKWDIKDAKKRLHRNDFEIPHHLELFDFIMEADKSNKAITSDLIIQKIKKEESLDHFGGEAAIRDMISIADSIDLEEELKSLKNKSTLRKILDLARGNDPEALIKIGLEAEKNASSSHTKLELKFISEISPDYFKKQPPEKPALLEFIKDGDVSGRKIPFLHKEITAMLIAEGGRGKTHLLMMLSACVATGIPFLGKFQIVQPGAVCVIVGENNRDDIHRLLFKTRGHIAKMIEDNEKRKAHDKWPSYPNAIERIEKFLCPISVHGMNAGLVDGKGNKTPFFTSLLKGLKEKEPDDGWQLIVLDPASRFAGPEAEKDNAIATAFISCLEEISDNLRGKPTVLLAHHKSKSGIRDSAGQADARGASALTDGVRWQASLAKDKDEETITIFELNKTNFTPPIDKFRIKKRFDGIAEFQNWEPQK